MLPPPSRERLLQLAPRTTSYAPKPFVLEHGGGGGWSAPPLHAVRAVIVCRPSAPCCEADAGAVSSALSSQSLRPVSLTLIHACKGSGSAALLRAARAHFPAATESLCTESAGGDLSSCLVRVLAEASALAAPYTLAIDSAVLLEPLAVEKLWLSLVLRPHVPAVRPRAYSAGSLGRESDTKDALAVRKITPDETALRPLPMLFNGSAIAAVRGGEMWREFVDVVSRARVLREALYTSLAEGDDGGVSFGRFERDELPAHLWSDLAFEKFAAQRDEDEVYQDRLFSWGQREGPVMDLSPVPFPARKGEGTSIFLVLPWMQMGGSEKCMLDIAERVRSMGWELTFVLTMPFWKEDDIGEVGLEHQWLNKALALSADTWDLLALALHEKSVRAYRHLLESRQPDYLLLANTRWAYSNSRFVKKIVPKTIVADYNHMIHMNWEGGGMPRYGANNSAFFDIHLTASRNVADAMKGWIEDGIMQANPDKVQPCYIGTDPNLLHAGQARLAARSRMRQRFNISDDQVVVLFAGRFVIDKGLDVIADVIDHVSKEKEMKEQLVFVFVGSGDEEVRLKPHLSTPSNEKLPRVVISPPAQGLLELRDYYALSEVFLLPSVNEGIALVVYEAMAGGVLVITTDVGGQKEIVTPESGILLPNYRSLSRMTTHTLDKLREVAYNPKLFEKTANTGRDIVRKTYTTEKFSSCVVENLVRASETRRKEEDDVASTQEKKEETITNVMEDQLILGAQTERFHGVWNLAASSRSIENSVTIGIKTYVCDGSIATQVESLLRSIRVHYPRVRILLGNDGPKLIESESFVQDDPFTEEIALPKDSGISHGRNHMVNMTRTRYFLLLDDDHVFDDTTNLTVLVNGIRNDHFDMVGLRVRNLPGIDELERIGIVIPRYVGMVQSLKERNLTMCVWNENNGPSIYGITHPISLDVLHNAFIASTDVVRKHPWRNELKVNEHMTFFLDAKDAGLKVGYLPSVFVHHRSRDYSDCYYKIRFREEEYTKLLPYKDEFSWDMKCQADFPEKIRTHILKYELDI